MSVRLCAGDWLITYLDEKHVGGGWFTFPDGRVEFARIMKTIFPDDPVIQGLKEE